MTQTKNQTLIERLLTPASAPVRTATPANGNGSSSVCWGTSPVAGRGLFASRAIAKGERIICSPALYVRGNDLDAIVSPYAFALDRDETPGHPQVGPVQFALVFGPVSLANHADTPNAAVTFIRSVERGLEAQVTALASITPGEEIFIRYPDRNRYQPAGWF